MGDGSVLVVVSEVTLLGWLLHCSHRQHGCWACLRRNERMTRCTHCGELPDAPGCIDAIIKCSVTAGSGCKAAAAYP
ncbi:hypothetical protein EDC04DRAFT_2769949 [Pisolithus marmoratus]|nr:hypothetical protein EDC04DRAFT_2769949 [Pisolithus marmoratus]